MLTKIAYALKTISLSIMPRYTLNYRLKNFQKQKFKKGFHYSKISAFHKSIKETDKGFWKKQMWSFVNSNTKVVTDSKFLHTFFVIYRETSMPLSQPAFTCSKPTIETLEKYVKSVQN